MPRPAARWAPVLLLVLALAAAPGAGADDTPRPKKRPRDFDFGQPEAPPTPAPTTPGAPASRPPAGAPADDPDGQVIRREVAALATWPARDGVRAAESLLLRGPAVCPYLVEALAATDRSVQPGAAWVLGRAGEPTHVVPILQSAARLNGWRAEVFFDAAHALAPERAKEWLIGFLSLDRAQLREEATRYLAKSVGPADAGRIALLVDADKVGARIAGLRLLEPARVADLEDRLTRALSDVAPQVSRVAATLLGLRAQAPELQRLNALAREGEARERAYAVLALADVARSRQLNPYEPLTLAEIIGRRGLLHPDKLNRVTAAVGLAYGALDATDETTMRLVDSTVVDVLVDALVGEHFRDFEVLSDPVFAALRRLSGQDLPANAVAWAAWWQGARGSFQARRALTAVAEADLPVSWVRYEAVASDGRRRNATFVAVGGSRAGAYVVPKAAFLSLVDALRDAGIFDARLRSRARSDEHVAVTLGVRNLESRLGLSPREDAERYAVLKLRFESLEEANLWQRYRDVDAWPDARAWWDATAQAFEQADPDVRADLLRSHVVNAFDDLGSDPARAEALDRLAASPVPLTKAQAATLLRAAVTAPAMGETEMRALRMALGDAADAGLQQQAVEGLAARGEPAALDVLAALLAQDGPERVRDAFADARPSVRRAASRAAVRLISLTDPSIDAAGAEQVVGRLRPGLDVLVKDEPAVAVEALVALSRLGEPTVMPQLEALYRAGDVGQKERVVEAAGWIPGDAAHGLLTMVLAETGPGTSGIRAAALRSLARTGHPNAVRLLRWYLLTDVAPDVQTAAADALAGLGTDEARFALLEELTKGEKDVGRRARLVDVLGRFDGRTVEEVLQRQLDDPAAEVVAVAALRGGAKGLAPAVPHLIALLRRGSDAQRDQALAVLEELTCRRLTATGYGEKADQYESWWATAKVGTDRTWFRDALEQRGYDVGQLNSYVKGDPGLAPVPTLLRALRDDDPALRVGAARGLERLAGRSFGPVGRGVPELEVVRAAELWVTWWETEGQATAPAGAPPR